MNTITPDDYFLLEFCDNEKFIDTDFACFYSAYMTNCRQETAADLLMIQQIKLDAYMEV